MRKIKLSFGRETCQTVRACLCKTKVWGKSILGKGGNKYKTFDAARKIEVKYKEELSGCKKKEVLRRRAALPSVSGGCTQLK